MIRSQMKEARKNRKKDSNPDKVTNPDEVINNMQEVVVDTTIKLRDMVQNQLNKRRKAQGLNNFRNKKDAPKHLRVEHESFR